MPDPRDIAADLAIKAIRDAANFNTADLEVRAELHRLAKTIEARPNYHVIEFSDTGWVLQHPIIGCGLNLFGCPTNRACDEQLDGPPPSGVGRYRIDVDPDNWLVIGERLSEE